MDKNAVACNVLRASIRALCGLSFPLSRCPCHKAKRGCAFMTFFKIIAHLKCSMARIRGSLASVWDLDVVKAHMIFRCCPKCKKRRRAVKRSSISRLPPILIVHLQRTVMSVFFSDKDDRPVEFPTSGLDLAEIAGEGYSGYLPGKTFLTREVHY